MLTPHFLSCHKPRLAAEAHATLAAIERQHGRDAGRAAGGLFATHPATEERPASPQPMAPQQPIAPQQQQQQQLNHSGQLQHQTSSSS